ncbi:hypothetical protein BDQ17DRAFT_1328313 [Cyathus striatus]|nr:hypothetical protein BDQ17DRAFT_1328313 [Cyathus striatus]
MSTLPLKEIHEVSSPLCQRHQEEPVTFENSPLQTFSNAATSYMPVAVEADDPFITMPQVHPVFTPHTPLHIHSAAHAPQPGSAESFPSPGPSGNKSGNKAKDVWEFYEEAGGFNYCKFCRIAKMKETRYALKTGTTVLQKHLCDAHGVEWTRPCEDLGVNITAKTAQSTLREYK